MRHVRSRSTIGAGVLLGLSVLAGCGLRPGQDGDRPPAGSGLPNSRPTPWIPGFVASMTTQEKAGQLFVPAVTSRTAAVRLIDRYHVGGLVYSASDAADPAGTANLSNRLQGASDLPLLLGFADPKAAPYLSRLPNGTQLAATGSAADAKSAASIARAEAHALGITPGWGPAGPYGGGTRTVVAGALVPDASGALRTSSSAWVRLADGHGLTRAAVVRAIRDGADQIVGPEDVGGDYDAVVAAVRNGTIPRDRLDSAVSRVLKLKEQRGLFGDTVADPARAAALTGTPAGRSMLRTVAADAITLVRNDGVLPIGRRKRVFVIGAQRDRLTEALRGAGLRITGYPGRADVVILATDSWGSSTASSVRTRAGYAPVVVVALGDPGDLAYLGRAKAGLAAYDSGGPALRAAARVIAGTLHPTGRLPVQVSKALPAGSSLTY